MLKLRKSQSGFTIIELLIVIAIIAILAGVVLVNFQGAQAKARDSQRLTDLRSLQAKLEEYYHDNSGYPSTFTAGSFTGIDPETLLDPNENTIVINSLVSDKSAADNIAAPTASSASDYIYIPYGPSGCTTSCSGYEIKAYIEKPTVQTPNPLIKYSLN